MSYVICAHALIRFVERVKGLDTKAARIASAKKYGPEFTDADLLKEIEAIHGVSASDIKQSMPMQRLLLAINCGSAGITIAGFRYVIECGVVVTVTCPNSKKLSINKRETSVRRTQREAAYEGL